MTIIIFIYASLFTTEIINIAILKHYIVFKVEEKKFFLPVNE